MRSGRVILILIGLLALSVAPSRAAEPAQSGPVWWKISDRGGSTLWILGMPDGMTMDVRWNDAPLGQRLSKAQRLISPLLGRPPTEPNANHTPIGDAQQPCSDLNAWQYSLDTAPGAVASQNIPASWVWWRTLGRNQYDPGILCDPDGSPPINSVTFKDPLSSRLTSQMMQRLQRDLPFMLGESRTLLLNGKTWEVALWMDLWNWPRGKLLGNPVTDKAQSLAQNQRIPIEIVQVPALWKPILVDAGLMPMGTEKWAEFDWLFDIRPNIRIEPPEALQQKCLTQVLDQTESGQMPALRQAGMEAWARGDLANALKRSNNIQLCLMGDLPSTNAEAFVTRQATLYVQSLDHAFEAPGQTVALVEFDPLLLKAGGVLDHYRALGYEITVSDGAE
ncbi:MAG: TraB/GumN family protein [Caulobacteraceae bacterium]|nr:TraB/GumN family protein [Caulobacteraceae bacterium]